MPLANIFCFSWCVVTVLSSESISALFLPQYSVYSCILSLAACAVFLRVSFELKVLFLTLASAVFYTIILSIKSQFFVAYANIIFAPGRNCSRWGSLGHNALLMTENMLLILFWECFFVNWMSFYYSEDASILRSIGLVKHPQVMSCIYITLFLVTMLIIAQQVINMNDWFVPTFNKKTEVTIWKMASFMEFLPVYVLFCVFGRMNPVFARTSCWNIKVVPNRMKSRPERI